ncbi:MAG: MaoC family dehydratase N-terminal domain-containing protein [Chloroflexi bacterium]|nr:MaoC family dehydratase N-terminal domain-containing protein [Chloroflexota bacterium]
MVDFDRSVLGKGFSSGTFTIEKETILEFCRAVGETNPLYVDEEAAKKGPYGGIIAPPTFYTLLRTYSTNQPDLKLKFGTAAYDGGESGEFFQPIRPGDTLTATSRFTEVYEKTGRSGKLVFMVRETTFTNQKGEKVVVSQQTLVRR